MLVLKNFRWRLLNEQVLIVSGKNIIARGDEVKSLDKKNEEAFRFVYKYFNLRNKCFEIQIYSCELFFLNVMGVIFWKLLGIISLKICGIFDKDA